MRLKEKKKRQKKALILETVISSRRLSHSRQGPAAPEPGSSWHAEPVHTGLGSQCAANTGSLSPGFFSEEFWTLVDLELLGPEYIVHNQKPSVTELSPSQGAPAAVHTPGLPLFQGLFVHNPGLQLFSII